MIGLIALFAQVALANPQHFQGGLTYVGTVQSDGTQVVLFDTHATLVDTNCPAVTPPSTSIDAYRALARRTKVTVESVEQVKAAGQKTTTVLAFDDSKSLVPVRPHLMDAASDFLDEAEKDPLNHEVGLVLGGTAFVTVLSPAAPSAAKQAFQTSIAPAAPYDNNSRLGTLLENAVGVAIGNNAWTSGGQRQIVLFSDGLDEDAGFDDARADQIIKTARDSGVRVYLVLATTNIDQKSSEDAKLTAFMRIAQETGGETSFVDVSKTKVDRKQLSCAAKRAAWGKGTTVRLKLRHCGAPADVNGNTSGYEDTLILEAWAAPPAVATPAPTSNGLFAGCAGPSTPASTGTSAPSPDTRVDATFTGVLNDTTRTVCCVPECGPGMECVANQCQPKPPSKLWWLLALVPLAWLLKKLMDDLRAPGDLAGTVTGPNGGPLANADVKVTGHGVVLHHTTGADGSFRFPGLAAATYAVEGSHVAFATASETAAVRRRGLTTVALRLKSLVAPTPEPCGTCRQSPCACTVAPLPSACPLCGSLTCRGNCNQFLPQTYLAIAGTRGFSVDRASMVIGRGVGPGIDFVTELPRTSGSHARVELFPNGTVRVTDLGSANGTWFRGARLPAQMPVEIPVGEEFFIGDASARFWRPAATDAPVAPPPQAHAPVPAPAPPPAPAPAPAPVPAPAKTVLRPPGQH